MDAVERTLGQGIVSKTRLQELQAALCRGRFDSLIITACAAEEPGQIKCSSWSAREKASYAPNARGWVSLYLASLAFILGITSRHLRFQTEQGCRQQAAERRTGGCIAALNKKLAATRNRMAGCRLGNDTTGRGVAPGTALVSVGRCGDRCRAIPRRQGDWPAGRPRTRESRLAQGAAAGSYDGKPLRWKRTPTGVIIYSSGKDKIDNGGNLNRSAAAGRGRH